MKVMQEEYVLLLTEQYGDDPLQWAWRCPACGDVATGADFKAALAEHPRTRKGGGPFTTSDVAGQECIGRTLGALQGSPDEWRKNGGRGCDWVAFGLFRGPWIVVTPEGHEVGAFEPAEHGPVQAVEAAS